VIYPELKAIVEQEGNEKDFEYKGYQCHIRRIGVPYRRFTTNVSERFL
jgi:hypothetical protein